MTDWGTVKGALPVSTSEEDRKKRAELWKQFKVTKSRHLALFELDSGIQKVLQSEELFDAKPAILRAFTYAREINPGGPKDKLEFCEFRLLLVYLKGLFDVYQLFTELDKSRDFELSLTELEAAGPRLEAAGITVPDPAALHAQLGGSNGRVEFSDFADWATRQGLAGPELLEVERANDAKAEEELSQQLKTMFHAWKLCDGGLVEMQHMKALVLHLHPTCKERPLEQLLDSRANSEGKVSVDRFIDCIFSPNP